MFLKIYKSFYYILTFKLLFCNLIMVCAIDERSIITCVDNNDARNASRAATHPSQGQELESLLTSQSFCLCLPFHQCLPWIGIVVFGTPNY